MKLDVLGDWPKLLGAIAAIAGIFSLTVTLVVNGRDGRFFRLLFGLFLAIVGLLAAVASVATLVDRRLSPLSGDGAVPAGIAAGGAVLVLAGGLIAARTPVAGLNALRLIAGEVQERLRAQNEEEGFGGHRTVPLRVKLSETSDRSVPLAKLVRRPTRQLTVVCGPPGSGKSYTVRAGVLSVCRRVRVGRRPKLVALHVDLRLLPPPAEPFDENMIREHLRASIIALPGLDSYLDRPGRPRWLFVFDLGDELTAARASQYIRAVRGFISARDDFAIVVTRTVPDDESAVTVAPLTPHQQRLLLTSFGVNRLTRRPVLFRLNHEPGLADIAASPLLLSLFIGRGMPGHELVGSRHEILGTNIIGHLDADALGPAGELAHRLTADPEAELPADAPATTKLVEAGLARAGRRGIRFRHSAIQDYLAGQHLRTAVGPVAELLSDERWHPATVAALQAGPSPFRDRVIDQIAGWVAEDTTAIPDLVAGPDDVDAGNLPGPGSFLWPRRTLDALLLVRNGFTRTSTDDWSTAAVPGADRLILTAATAGAHNERMHGINLLPVASRPAAVKLAEYMLGSKGLGDLKTKVIDQLAVRPDVYDGLSGTAKAMVLISAFSDLYARVLLTAPQENQRPRSLQYPIHRIIQLGQYTAIVLALLVVGAVLSAPTIEGAGFAAGAVGVLAGFLLGSYLPFRPGLNAAGFFCGAILLAAGLYYFVLGVPIYLVSLVTDAASVDAGSAIVDLILFWSASWVPAMVLYTVANPDAAKFCWLPQLKLAQNHDARAVARQVGVEIWTYVSNPVRVVAALVTTALGIVIWSDLPLDDAAEKTLDRPLFLVFLATLVVVVEPDLLKKLWRRSQARLPADSAGTLDLFLVAPGKDRYDIGIGLRRLTGASPAEIERSGRILADLAAVLEFIRATLPGKMTEPIRDRQWDLMRMSLRSRNVAPEFYAMVRGCDKRNPGNLAQLANSAETRKLLGKLDPHATGATRDSVKHG